MAKGFVGWLRIMKWTDTTRSRVKTGPWRAIAVHPDPAVVEDYLREYVEKNRRRLWVECSVIVRPGGQGTSPVPKELERRRQWRKYGTGLPRAE